jgi:hypothetical protein
VQSHCAPWGIPTHRSRNFRTEPRACAPYCHMAPWGAFEWVGRRRASGAREGETFAPFAPRPFLTVAPREDRRALRATTIVTLHVSAFAWGPELSAAAVSLKGATRRGRLVGDLDAVARPRASAHPSRGPWGVSGRRTLATESTLISSA